MDVHKKTVNVCIRLGKGNKLQIFTALFGTFTEDLERLRDFLRQHKVHRLIMESTGVYWMPVWNVLERGDWKFDLVLVNPQHVRALPGQKTDRKTASDWLSSVSTTCCAGVLSRLAISESCGI
jgi:transposase